MTKRIAILGDFNPAYITHHALNDSVRNILRNIQEDIQIDWISTDTFAYKIAFHKMYCGLWIAPGSPYKDMQNVIKSIQYTREYHIPTFGNCGGFQHMLIEYARNVCGITQADHEETNPDADNLIISKLSCSLVEQQEQLTIIDKNSLMYRIVQKEKLSGKYFCSYGLNGKYLDILISHGLKITAVSEDKEVRAFELDTHPFYLGTLFQPALTSTMNEPNPLIEAFVRFAINR